MNLYENIVEAQTDLICRFLPNGTLTYVNPAYCNYFNKLREELVGHSFMPLIPPEDQEVLNASLAKISPDNPTETVRHRVILADGSIRWQEWTDTFIYDEHGNFIEGQAVGRDITEQKELELALTKSSQTLGAFFDLAPVLMTIQNFDGSVIRINQAVEELLGYTVQELTHSEQLSDFVRPEDHAFRDAMFNAMLSSPGVYNFELIHLTKDNVPKLISWRCTAEADQRRIYSVGRDITEEKKTEQELADTTHMLSAFYDDAPVMMSIVTFEGETLRANDRMCHVLEYTQEEIAQVPREQRYAPTDLAKRNAVWRDLVENGGSHQIELTLVTKHGETRITDWRFTADQERQRMYCIGQDITEQRQLEEEKRRESAQFRNVVTAMPGGIVYANTKREITLVNPSFTRMFGYTPEEVQGFQTKILYADPKGFVKSGSERFNPDAEINYDPIPTTFKRKNGETFLGETVGVRINDDNGNLIGYLGIIRDITNRVRMEKELKELNENLEHRVEQRTQEIRDLVHKITHDFRAPIRAINNYSIFIEEDYGERLDETGISYLDAIRENTTYVSQLVQDLLDYYKIRYNQGYSFGPLNLGQQIHAIASRSEAAGRGNITITEEWPTIFANASLLGQAISNLLDNAIKYRRADTPIQIEIALDDTETHWGIRIQDNGIGIQEKFLEKVFGMFERLHTQEEYDGTGIGLAIVNSVASVHNGYVTVNSTVGEGSTFTVYISKDLTPDG